MTTTEDSRDHQSDRGALPASYRYRAFISYSHKADREVARLLQAALEKIGKPWYRRRALAIFRDDTDLAIDPQLWPRIESGLAESAYLLLLANPVSARSAGVGREVHHWTQVLQRDAKTIFIVQTGGSIVWDGQANDFDWSQTDLPEQLKQSFVGGAEPLWADLSARAVPATKADDPVFREGALKLAAALHGVRPRDLESADLREHQKTIRTFTTLAMALFLLLAVVAFLYVDVRHQRNEAERRGRIASSRALAMQAMDRGDKHTDLALLLGVESHRAADTMESRKAMLGNLLASPHLARYIAGGGAATALARHPTRPIVAEASEHALWVWDLRSGGPPVDFGRSGETYLAIGYSGSGADLLAVTSAGDLVAWDLNTATRRSTLERSAASKAPGRAPGPPGTILAASTPSGVVVWDADRKAVLAAIPAAEDEVHAVATSPTGDVVAIATGNRIRLWDVATAAYLPTRFEGHASRIDALALSADGHKMVSGSMDESVMLWDVRSGWISKKWLKLGAWVSAAAFSPDGRYLAWGTYGDRIVVHDLAERTDFAINQRDLPEGIGALVFSADSRTLVVGGRLGGGLVEFDLTATTPIAQYRQAHLAWITGAAISADGKRAYTASNDGELDVWNAHSKGVSLRSATGARLGRCLRLSPDGKMLASCGRAHDLLLWNVKDDGIEALAPLGGAKAAVSAIGFEPSGSTIVWGDEGGRLLAWDRADLHGRAGRHIAALGCRISAVAMSPGGRRIGAGCDDGTIHLFDASGAPLGTLPGGGNAIVGMKFGIEGRDLISADATGVAVWSLETRARLRGPLAILGSSPSSFDASADGTLAVTASRGGWMGIWDTATGALLGQVRSEANDFLSVAMRADGMQVIAGSGSDAISQGQDALVFLDMDPDHWASYACAIAGRDLTAEERRRYVGDAAPPQTCRSDSAQARPR